MKRRHLQKKPLLEEGLSWLTVPDGEFIMAKEVYQL